MSDTLEHVGNVPLEYRPNGGRLVGRYFYLTTGGDLTIFDVANPESPVAVARMEWSPLDAYYLTGYQEDVDTNGRLLIRTDGSFRVVDVSNPRAPKEIGSLDGVSAHTISCVLDCTWAYGSEGQIVDLRDPTRPVEAGDWTTGTGAQDSFGHDVTEVAPGIVLTATDPMVLLDARADPANPTVLAEADAPGFVHGTHWPNGMADRFALAGGEAVGPGCSDAEGATLQTWDTSGWQASRTFRLVDEYRLANGTIADGRHLEARYCGHWFDPHPAFRDGGLVTMAWYEHGTRFVRVGSDGRMQEAGWFLPPDGWAWGAYWITDRIVYVADHHRGIDILRFKGEVPVAPSAPAPTAAPPPGSGPASGERPQPRGRRRLADLLALPPSGRCLARRSLSLRLRRPGDVRSVRARIRGRRVLAASGRALRRPLVVRRVPRRRFRLEVVLVTAAGERLRGRRTYAPCRRR